MPRAKRRGVPLDGMLLLDKPAGPSSNQALQRVKHLLNARKVGHTGTLDPIATGLLPLCFGETTKVSGLFLDANKHYQTCIRLGVATDTGDRQGAIVRERPVAVSRRQLDAALARFRGHFTQIPPMYSALKQNGQPLYKLAREGVSVARAPRPVTVYALTLEAWRDDLLVLRIACSRGFYVRTLAADLGEALGCGAHVRELRRTGVGGFRVEDAVTVAQLEAADCPAARQAFLFPTERALAHLPEINLPDNLAFYLCRGRAVRAPVSPSVSSGRPPKTPPTGLVRVYSDGAGFLGLAELTDDGKVTPRRLFHIP